MPGPHPPDLGELLHALLDTIRAGEEPILSAHGLSMWDYIILTRLANTSAPTQSRLAETTGRDKTRLITHLDKLETAQLVTRHPDPRDRRNRIVEVTAHGRQVWQQCRTDIHAMEADLLEALPERRRNAWRSDLAKIVATKRHSPTAD